MQKADSVHSSRRGPVVVSAFTLIVAGVLAFGNGLRTPFIFDDGPAIEENRSIRTVWPPAAVLSPPKNTTVAGRPILNLTFALNYALDGLDVTGYHETNIAIHITAGLVLFGLVRRTLLLPELLRRFGEFATGAAWSAALLWLVHPLQTESVTYVVQRAESLSGLFYLCVLYCFLRSVTTRGRRWPIACIAACALGVASKETVATAPLVVFLFDRQMFGGTFSHVLKRRGLLYGGLAVSWIILAVLTYASPRGASAGFGLETVSSVGYLLAQCEVTVHYLRLAFWPVGLCLDYAWAIPDSAWPVLPSALLLIALLAATLIGVLRRNPVAFLGVWFFFILSPTSSVIPIADAAFEHRMYLPLAAVTTLFSVIVWRWAAGRDVHRSTMRAAGRRMRGAAVVAMTLLLSTALAFAARSRNEDYRSPEVMWRDVLAKRPNNARAHYNLAAALHVEGDIDGALRHLGETVRLRPNDGLAFNRQGTILSEAGRLDEAVAAYQRAIQLEPLDAEARYNLGVALGRMGKEREAARRYEEAIALDPTLSRAWFNLGNIDARSENWRRAAERFERAVEFDGDSVDARVNLSGAQQRLGLSGEAERNLAAAMTSAERQAVAARAAGRWREAVEMQSKLVFLRPTDAAGRMLLARDLARLGRKADAVLQCREVLRMAPGNAAAIAFMGELERTSVEETREP